MKNMISKTSLSPAFWIFLLSAGLFLLGPSATETALSQDVLPRILSDFHDIGTFRTTKTNRGYTFDGQYTRQPREYVRIGGLWVGGVVGKDTLVSVAVDDSWDFFSFFQVFEFWPDENSTIIRRSINASDPSFSSEAISEQDLIVTYYDTLRESNLTGVDFIDNRPHIPMNLKVEERSYQWSYEYADDFILFDYEITNIGNEDITDVYVGFYVDGDVFFGSGVGEVAIVSRPEFTSGTNTDDIVGFMESFPAECGFRDTLNIAYITDNDGDPNPPNKWNTLYSLRHIAGVRVLRKPGPQAKRSFNWWNFSFQGSFGPRSIGTDELPFRNMNGILGAPFGDRNKYYIMRNGEHDYDQVETFLDHSSEGFLPPPAAALGISSGSEVRMLLSFGPVSLFPGQSIPLTVALIGAQNAHSEATNYEDLWDPFQPSKFMNTLDLAPFALNARWAGWVYDNPGVDTDADGFAGKFRDCVVGTKTIIDTTYLVDSSITPPETTLAIDTSLGDDIRRQFYEGDGVPDFQATAPPPAPVVRVIPGNGTLTVQWNGFASQNTPDPLTGLLDFEGYRLYTSYSTELSDFVLRASYDYKNFNRFEYDNVFGDFVLPDPPFSPEQLRALYGDGFDPLIYTVDDPLIIEDPFSGQTKVYYFTKQDWNESQLGAPGGIRKIYPNAPYPGIIKNNWTDADLTDKRQPKYWEYEYVIEGQLSSVMQYVSVTAFDYGSRIVSLTSLETNPLFNAVEAFALPAAEYFSVGELDVTVYPNPYRIDGNYRSDGYEGRAGTGLPEDRTREIHFANLPQECLIRIFSLDGDLVRELIHDKQITDATSMHESWDVISRNLLPVASGIYYWSVETPDGRSQVGKLVIIM